MSNPLLRPNDPRFTQPSPLDAEGRNIFAEGRESEIVAPAANHQDGSSVADDNLYRSAAENNPYQPRYEVSQRPRGRLLLVLAVTGLVGSLCGVSALAGWWVLGWFPSFLAIVPAGCALVLGSQDLRAIRMGAMDPQGESLTQIAYWLGGLGVFTSLAMDGTVLFFVIYFLMSLV
jgi:hypothetical protein